MQEELLKGCPDPVIQQESTPGELLPTTHVSEFFFWKIQTRNTQHLHTQQAFFFFLLKRAEEKTNVSLLGHGLAQEHKSSTV